MKQTQERVIQERERQLVQKENEKRIREKERQKEKGRLFYCKIFYIKII